MTCSPCSKGDTRYLTINNMSGQRNNEGAAVGKLALLNSLCCRLAAKLPSVAFMHLDVEVSMANKLLAYEKTLERADSRRRGAKPVVRNAGRFPCISLHQPSNLVPLRIFTGPTALEELVKELQMTLPAAQAASTSAAASRPTAKGAPQREAAYEDIVSPAEAPESAVDLSATPTTPGQSQVTHLREESTTTGEARFAAHASAHSCKLIPAGSRTSSSLRLPYLPCRCSC